MSLFYTFYVALSTLLMWKGKLVHFMWHKEIILGAFTNLADEQTIFGKWLEEQLAKKEMTQVELARRIKKTREQIRRIINGESGTRRDTAEAIAIALGVPVRDALKAAGFDYTEMPVSDSSENNPSLTKIYEILPAPDKDELLKIALFKWQRLHPGQAPPQNEASQKLSERWQIRGLTIDLDDGYLYGPDGAELNDETFLAVVKYLAQLVSVYHRSKLAVSETSPVLEKIREVFRLPDLPLPDEEKNNNNVSEIRT